MKELIQAIEAMKPTMWCCDEDVAVDNTLSEIIDLINTHMAGRVIVPVELIQNINDLTEAGFTADIFIDELCALLPSSDTHEAN